MALGIYNRLHGKISIYKKSELYTTCSELVVTPNYSPILVHAIHSIKSNNYNDKKICDYIRYRTMEYVQTANHLVHTEKCNKNW